MEKEDYLILFIVGVSLIVLFIVGLKIGKEIVYSDIMKKQSIIVNHNTYFCKIIKTDKDSIND